MKKGEKQILIKSNVKINKKSEKLTKDEKEELEDLCQQIHIAMWESKKIPYLDNHCLYPIPYCEIPIRAIADEVLKDNFKDKDLKTQSRRIYYMCLKQMKAHKGKNNTVVSVICVIAALGLVIYGLTSAASSLKSPCIILAAVLAVIGAWGTIDTSPRFTKAYIKDLHDSAYRLMHRQQR